jgi:Rab-GTPase-TBC domain
MQDNAFFQEPSTQRTLLDILFIYSKLHPDIGYRQGMHELLAPILWVVFCDASEADPLGRKKAADDLMLDVLNRQFIDHDSFTLFCAVMQTAKSFYEIGDSNSPIVERSRRIHDEYLSEVDMELANHLRALQILPQIFLLRWIRLLFGREFDLEETLSIWDVLFAAGFSLSLVDMTCLAMLLRIRVQCRKPHDPPTGSQGLTMVNSIASRSCRGATIITALRGTASTQWPSNIGARCYFPRPQQDFGGWGKPDCSVFWPQRVPYQALSSTAKKTTSSAA